MHPNDHLNRELDDSSVDGIGFASIFRKKHQSWGCMGNGGSTTPKVGSDRTHIGC